MLKKWRDYLLIKRSGFFDTAYYLLNNPDVRQADIDPLMHFIKFGWREGRNPSKNFDTNYYLESNPDVKQAGINPLVHYLKHGKQEGRTARPSRFSGQDNIKYSYSKEKTGRTDKTSFNNSYQGKYHDLWVRSINILLKQGPIELIRKIIQYRKRKTDLVDTAREIRVSAERPKISIIIPVFNMCSLTRQCVESIYRESKPESIELVIIDNASEDQTSEWLNSEKEKHPFFEVFRMEQNIGFGSAVNFGIRKSQGDFVVILNNDTIVSPGWIENLLLVLENNPSIGIVSPVTNYVGEGPQIDSAATKLSPDIKQIQKYASIIQTRTELIIEPNRLVFFCVMMRREIIDIVGYLDTSYEKGNFEDDDYCLRTRMAGYQLAIVSNSFVYHLGSVTFAKNKISHNDYMEQNRIRFYQKAGRIATSIKKFKFVPRRGDIEVSVIVRTMNRPKLLEKALNSLANQSCQNFEVVVVNDGGADIPDVLQRFNELLTINYVHNKKNRGRSGAANIGLDNCQGNWITFLDDDDIVYPWHLEVLVQVIKQQHSKFVYSNYNRSLFLNDYRMTPDILQGAPVWEYNRRDLLVSNYLPIHTWLFDRKCIQQIGMFDENLDRLEDYDFLLRFSSLSSFYHVSKVTCEYRYYLQSANSVYTEREKSKGALESIYNRYPVDTKELLFKRKDVIRDLDHQIHQIEEIKKEAGITMTELEAKREIVRLVAGI